MSGIADFQRRNRLFGFVAAAAIMAIMAVMALTVIVLALRWDMMALQTIRRLALIWAPVPFYLWALWSLNRMFAGFADAGPVFRPVLATGLMRIAWGLILGAGTAILLTPALLTIAPARPMGGTFAVFNVPALTLATVGLALLAVAHMLHRGLEIAVEAASLKAELGEFV